jgi:tRNA threonylcarbamoyladenosine biosynthesis protein TsaB
MKLLALETSGPALSLALKVDDQVVSIHHLMPQQQTHFILPEIDQLLKSNNVKLNHLDAIAFGCGPGSFTGIRIAASVAQGLAFPFQIPLIPISSLKILAATAYQERQWSKVLIAVDARMQEVYWAQYEMKQGVPVLLGSESVIKPKAIAFPATDEWYAVGDGWGIYSQEMNFNPLARDVKLLPNAAALISLAEVCFKEGETLSCLEAFPHYIRNNAWQPQSSS